jgi:hyperosmotically inducible protein
MRTALHLSLYAAAALVAATLAGASAAQQSPTSQPSNTESTREYIDDAAITAKVKAALVTDKETKASEVKVETDRGVVHLTGTVDSQGMADKSAEVARTVKGVQSVRNDLHVR